MNRVRLAVASVAVMVGIGYILMQTTQYFSTYFVTVREFRARPNAFGGRLVRVQGKLLGNSVHYNQAHDALTFSLTSGGIALPVQYRGALPNERFQNVNAIVKGRLTASGVFKADKLMIQCPNHYNSAPSMTGSRTGSSSQNYHKIVR